MGKIRLACLFCDRDDCDGVETVPVAWFSVAETQAYEASLQEACIGADPWAWYTHLGVCPDCQTTELWPAKASEVSR